MLLLFSTEQQDRFDTKGRGGEGAGKARINVTKGLTDMANRLCIQANATVLFGHIHGVETHLAHPLMDRHRIFAALVDVRYNGRQLFVQHLTHHLDQIFLFLCHHLIFEQNKHPLRQ